MWNIPTKERLEKIPRLYETEDVPLKEKFIHLHFFIAGSDWYIAEYDGHDLFWGYAILNGDTDMAEWGYISFKELRDLSINGIEIDCEHSEYWKIRKASEIEKVRKGNGWDVHSKNKIDIEALLEQAVNDNVIELPCTVCGATLSCKPDATESFCFDCGKSVPTNNPLIKMGLI